MDVKNLNLSESFTIDQLIFFLIEKGIKLWKKKETLKIASQIAHLY